MTISLNAYSLGFQPLRAGDRKGQSGDICSRSNQQKASVTSEVVRELGFGLIVDCQVFFKGASKNVRTSDIEYPPQVRESINAKIEATQRAMLRENEFAQSKAEAEKARVAAQGEADAQLTKAKAEAESIAIRAKALRDNPQVLTLEAISRWDGKLPTFLGGDSLPLLDVNKAALAK